MSRTGPKVSLNATQCKYSVIRNCALERQWKVVEKEDGRPKCNLYWIDTPEIQDIFRKLLPYQKVNHFPGMSNIARKSRLAKNIESIRKKFPREYDFSPRTWTLPLEYNDFRQQFNQSGQSNKTYIIKPDAGCQGRGVYLTKQLDKISGTECQVAQRYIRHPLLIEGKKFDLRVYVLMTSCNPLKVYLFKDGLVRLCTTDYVTPSSANLDKRYMHLTNYAINKFSEDYVAGAENEDEDNSSSKRSISWFFGWFDRMYGIEKRKAMWTGVGDLCVKTLMSIQPILSQEYSSIFAKFSKQSSIFDAVNETKASSCFEVLGFDVLLDAKLKPWLIEVNHLPSFKCDSALDKDIKTRLIEQTLELIELSEDDEKKYDEQQTISAQGRLLRNKPSTILQSNNQRSSPLTTPRASFDRALTKDELRSALIMFYEKFNPSKDFDAEAIIEKYYNHQKELDANLQVKYSASLLDMFQNCPSQSRPESSSANSPETLNCPDFDLIFPCADTAKLQKYNEILEAAEHQLSKLQMRMHAPLQQRRGEAKSLQLPSLTPEVDERKEKTQLSEAEQSAAANRLMRGHSSISNNLNGLPDIHAKQKRIPNVVKTQALSDGMAYRLRLQGNRGRQVALAQVTLGNFPAIQTNFPF